MKTICFDEQEILNAQHKALMQIYQEDYDSYPDFHLTAGLGFSNSQYEELMEVQI